MDVQFVTSGLSRQNNKRLLCPPCGRNSSKEPQAGRGLMGQQSGQFGSSLVPMIEPLTIRVQNLGQNSGGFGESPERCNFPTSPGKGGSKQKLG